MARSSPAVRRLADILEVLAARPQDALSLSEIARRTGLSMATAHSMLNGLADEGLLHREPGTKRFALGPVLIRLGAAAAQRPDDAVARARAELKPLVAEIGLQGLQATVTRVVGEHIVIEAQEGDPGPWGTALQVGRRLPMAPPLGSVYVAWSGTPAFEEWVDRLDTPISTATRERCLDALAAVRSYGYAASLDVPAAHRRVDRGELHPGLAELLESSYSLTEIDDEAVYSIRQIAAPVFDERGDVAAAVAAVYQGTARTGRDVVCEARLVVAAAERVTRGIEGTHPDGWLKEPA